jgi:mRNA-degrading endonuclease RelE of RelBE toxin-antitoxin system
LPKLNQQLKKLEPEGRKRLNDALNTQQQENAAQIEFAPYDTAQVLLEDI